MNVPTRTVTLVGGSSAGDGSGDDDIIAHTQYAVTARCTDKQMDANITKVTKDQPGTLHLPGW